MQALFRIRVRWAYVAWHHICSPDTSNGMSIEFEEKRNWDGTKEEVLTDVVAMVHLECGIIDFRSGRVDSAKLKFDVAEKIVMYGKSLKQDGVVAQGLQNCRARERERECLYPDACGGGGRGWINHFSCFLVRTRKGDTTFSSKDGGGFYGTPNVQVKWNVMHSHFILDGIAYMFRMVVYVKAIRQLAYGTVPDALDEYLQMGNATSRQCLEYFCTSIIQIFGGGISPMVSGGRT
nr:tetratricopeptide repeat protein 27 homolog [Tanacetum cinerariifolium]